MIKFRLSLTDNDLQQWVYFVAHVRATRGAFSKGRKILLTVCASLLAILYVLEGNLAKAAVVAALFGVTYWLLSRLTNKVRSRPFSGGPMQLKGLAQKQMDYALARVKARLDQQGMLQPFDVVVTDHGLMVMPQGKEVPIDADRYRIYEELGYFFVMPKVLKRGNDYLPLPIPKAQVPDVPALSAALRMYDAGTTTK